MYHGDVVPGFPQHPHRGFETVTLVRRGLIDHSDSLGAAARFGEGDVQWLTAGRGIVHSEMFPLLKQDEANPVELFQIWLNLPRADKLAEPHFSMLWGPTIPKRDRRRTTPVASRRSRSSPGGSATRTPPPPPPQSWASRPQSDVAIWTIRLEPGATWTLPPAAPGRNRTLYFFRGATLRVAGRDVAASHSVELRADVRGRGSRTGRRRASCCCSRAGRIGEPVAQYGPFVMNTPRRSSRRSPTTTAPASAAGRGRATRPVHGDAPERFARHPDGRIERVGELAPAEATAR